jgi:hypothetical protein
VAFVAGLHVRRLGMPIYRALVPAVAGASLLVSAGLAQERNLPAQANESGDAITANADQRTPIALSDHESAYIRREMRGLLETLREILDASTAGDRAHIVAAGRRAGTNDPETEHIPNSLASKLPPEFKKLGLATHRGFDQIALDADQFGAADLTSKQVVELMRNCVSCHAAWRLTGEGKH